MRRMLIQCDHCRKEIEEQDTYKIAVFNMDAPDKEFSNNIDLCHDCAERFMVSLYERPVMEEEQKDLEVKEEQVKIEKQETQKNKGGRPKKKIAPKANNDPYDKGKIFALRNAGWTWPSIRKELGLECSDAMIAKLYSEYLAESFKEAI